MICTVTVHQTGVELITEGKAVYWDVYFMLCGKVTARLVNRM